MIGKKETEKIINLPTKCPTCPAKNMKAVLDKKGVCPVCGTKVTVMGGKHGLRRY